MTPEERATVTRAADMLLAMHQATGLDLTNNADDLLNLVLLVYPEAVLAGTGPNSEHVMHTQHEMGGYVLSGSREAAVTWLSTY